MGEINNSNNIYTFKTQEIMKREYLFHETYLRIANNIAQLSRARRKKVGSIIVDKNDNIISYGFNGTPKGFDNNCEHENEDGSLTTKEEVLHAESNAITKVAKSTNSSVDTTLYVTLSPCFQCAKLIVQAGIKEVYYIEQYRDSKGIDFLKECGVIVKQIDIE